jgi:hypothetical protein
MRVATFAMGLIGLMPGVAMGFFGELTSVGRLDHVLSSDGRKGSSDDGCQGCGAYAAGSQTNNQSGEQCISDVRQDAMDGRCIPSEAPPCVPDPAKWCGLTNVSVSFVCDWDVEDVFCVNYGWNGNQVYEPSWWDPNLGAPYWETGEEQYELKGACGGANYSQVFALFKGDCISGPQDPPLIHITLTWSCFPCGETPV